MDNKKFEIGHLYNVALQNIELKRWTEAYCLLERLIQENPSHTDAHIYFGWLLGFQMEVPQEAEKHFSIAYHSEFPIKSSIGRKHQNTRILPFWGVLTLNVGRNTTIRL